MHSWRPYAKHPTFEFGQQGDRDRKFKVDIGERGTTIEVQETLRWEGEEAIGDRRLHLALNSGHGGWFPDVIQWSCAAPTRRLMKTHAFNGASQMIPRPCIRSACRRVRFRSIVHTNGTPSITNVALVGKNFKNCTLSHLTSAAMIRRNGSFVIPFFMLEDDTTARTCSKWP